MPGVETAEAWPLTAAGRQRIMILLAFVIGVAVMLSYRPWNRIEIGDPAFYDYVAQSILRRQIPYRDVVDIKGPGAAYVSALAMFAGKTIGLRDIVAVRLMNVILVGILSAVTYLVAFGYLKNKLLAIIALLIPLMPKAFTTMVTSGTQPKLLMILFGLISLLMVAYERPFLAGFFSMLSCLCWQPGLLFTGTAVLILSRYLTRWRDRTIPLILFGASIPLIIVLGYFYLNGALGDLWAWTITYNYTVFGPEAKAGIADALNKLWTIARGVFRPTVVSEGNGSIARLAFWFETASGLVTLAMIPAALIGLLIFAAERIRTVFVRPFTAANRYTDALLFPPAIYLLFCLINFQAGADLIPFFPFIGIFAALFIVKAGSYVTSALKDNGLISRIQTLFPITVIALIVIILVGHAVNYREDQRTLQDQDQEFKIVADLLGPDDRIYVHGAIELLVLMNRPNMNPYILMDWDADTFAGSRIPGGWDAIMSEMESMSPKIVALARLRAVRHRADFERWVSEHYDPLALPREDRVFIRRQ